MKNIARDFIWRILEVGSIKKALEKGVKFIQPRKKNWVLLLRPLKIGEIRQIAIVEWRVFLKKGICENANKEKHKNFKDDID